MLNTITIEETTTRGVTCKQTNVLFEEPWWMDAVAPGAWDAVTVVKGGEIFARLPFARREKYGVSVLGSPPLTPVLGPWLRPSQGKYAGQLSRQKELVTALIDSLPEADLFAQTLVPEYGNALPFYWKGWRYSPHYTYRFEDISDLDSVWSEFTNERRNVIRRAEKTVAVRDDLALETFCRLMTNTWNVQNLKPPYTPDLLDRIDTACRTRGARKLIYAEDANGNVHAALYIVWDDRAAYYLLGGGAPEHKSSGAYSLLLWEAVKLASARTKVFDFAGSANIDIEHFFRTFGARQTPLLHVRRESRRMMALNALRDLSVALMGWNITRPF